MVNATPSEIAKQQAAAKKALEERLARQKELRENPDKLAAAIADEIRNDIHAGEDPIEYDNGQMHWFQGAWGNVKARVGSFAKLTRPIRLWGSEKEWGPDNHDYFEVSCPTTGCIAGWADSLCGYPLVFRKEFSDYLLSDLREDKPDAAVEELMVDYFGEGQIIAVDDCYDPFDKEVRSIGDVAAELLALTTTQRDWLFDGNRTKDEVLFALDKIAAGEDWYTDDYGYDSDDYEDSEDYEGADA